MTTPAETERPRIRAFSHQSTNRAVFDIVRPLLGAAVRVLDVGAGEGFFSKVVGDHLQSRGIAPPTVLAACDVAPEIFRYDEIPCNRVAADGTLPYADESFNVVCSLEVLEHVEDQFAFCREIMRVLKPGGTAVLSTPNVLNMNSRYRVLHSGFATLFNPVSLSGRDALHTSGHIHPVSYYYVALAMHRAGAATVTVAFDRFKRSALALLFLTWPVVLLGHIGFRLKLRRKQPDVLRDNLHLLGQMQSFRMLTSRSIVVLATRAPAFAGRG
ncbi:MAG: methyltransferase domain-containing protein [Gemmatimonadaceae bacterium]